MKIFDKIIAAVARLLFRPTELEEQFAFLESIGSCVTFFPAYGNCQTFVSIFIHPEGPSGYCQGVHGKTFKQAVDKAKLALCVYRSEKAAALVN